MARKSTSRSPSGRKKLKNGTGFMINKPVLAASQVNINDTNFEGVLPPIDGRNSVYPLASNSRISQLRRASRTSVS